MQIEFLLPVKNAGSLLRNRRLILISRTQYEYRYLLPLLVETGTLH